MPRDLHALLRFLIALYFIATFAVTGLYMRLHDTRRGVVIERPVVIHAVTARQP